MRPLFAILIAMFLLGGTYAYTKFAASVRATAANYESKLAEEVYSVEIRRTFVAAPSSNGPQEISARYFGPAANALKLVFQGKPLLERNDEIPASDIVEIADIHDVEIGFNELFVSAHIKTPASDFAALNVRVVKDGIAIAESTFTSVSGSSLVYGVVVFEAAWPTAEKSSH